MLTITFLVLELWNMLWKPRPVAGQGLHRKSSFRTRQKELPSYDQGHQQEKQEQERVTSSTTTTTTTAAAAATPTVFTPGVFIKPITATTASSVSESSIGDRSSSSSVSDSSSSVSASIPSSGVGGDKRSISPRIPVPAKPVVPSVQPKVASETRQASPPAVSKKPQQQQQQQQQQQKQPQSTSKIPTPVQMSATKQIPTPDVSGHKMDENWAKSQISNFRFSFEQADKDKSGNLSFDEVYTVLQGNGFRGNKQEAQFIFGQMDKDGSQQVTRDEFSKAMEGMPRMSIREYCLRKIFLNLDKDKTGKLSKQEIMDATKKDGGPGLSAQYVSDLLVYLSKEDDDDKVDYNEYLRVMGVGSSAIPLTKIFDTLDADGSGFLSRDEVLQAVKTDFELRLSAAKISDLVIHLVTDQDKKISRSEFMAVWLKK